LDGAHEIIARLPSFPFSLDWLPDGRLLIIAGQERKLLQMAPDGVLITYFDLSSHTEHGFNEIVVDSKGYAYVNGGAFGEMASGFIIVVKSDGTAMGVAEGLDFPNGMAVTPDNSTLIVAESYGKKLTAFDIDTDGSLSNRRTWAELNDGSPDGICLDTEGAVWYADVPNKRCVRVAEGGKVLQTVQLDRGAFACMLGGADRKTLFILAAEWHGFEKMMDDSRTGKVLCLEVPVAGAGRP
jgi:sugar lactone lactonase YvrE